ncbi:MAG: gamma-glutamyltransferase family protein, partial [Propionibacteriaceae bacterium]|nr:gamma-glutamyltransferase family protein [Propionibacteriaceae bacterium]
MAAWYVNLAARASLVSLREWLALGTDLRAAQSAWDAVRVKELSAGRTALESRVVRDLTAHLGALGVPVSASAMDEVRATLRAALASQDAADAVAAGCLSRSLTYGGFGEVDLSAALAAMASEPEVEPEPEPEVEAEVEPEPEVEAEPEPEEEAEPEVEPEPEPEPVQRRHDHLATPGVRQPVFARRGVVCTSHPLAASAGLRILQAGGNAVDAAIATAACLTVLEPCSNGLGSDAFALIWDGERLHGLNGSGRAPAAASADRLRDRGLTTVPEHGWDAVTVPGMVRAWADVHERFGRLDFADVLAPAVEYAEHGAPVPGVVAWGWGRGVRAVEKRQGQRFDPAQEHFLPLFGPAPAVGEVRALPELAGTLRAIAATRGEDFYSGEFAGRIADFAAATGGVLTRADLAEHRSQWVEPISARYRDHEVWEIPPNGQGIATLIALSVLDGLPVEQAADWHTQIEAVKLALADTHALVADPDVAAVPTAELLSAEHAARRRAALGERAGTPVAVDPRGSDTVYLCTADEDGMMVSFIQSNFAGFGSGVVVPDTGIALQNRGSGFSLEPGHPNELAPGKRPFHTIIPGFLTRGGQPVGPFGVMGGHMQAQGHLQVALHTIDAGLDPQS